MKKYISILFVAVLSFFSCLYAQDYYAPNYYIVQPDEQSFMFESAKVAPLQSGIFSEVMGQFGVHPLSAINRNPANIRNFSSDNYFYFDVRTRPKKYESGYRACSLCSDFYPTYIIPPVEKRQSNVQEPLISSALFFKPFEESSFKIGLAYQHLNVEETYYSMVSPGVTGGGVFFRLLNASNADNLLGSPNQMKKYGHFPTFYTGFELSEKLSFGLKAGYANYISNGYQISGDFGGANPRPNYEDGFYPGVKTNNQRSVNYQHWDFSAGLNYNPNDHNSVGLSIGYLNGNFDQSARNQFLYVLVEEEQARSTKGLFEFTDRQGFLRDGDRLYTDLSYTIDVSNTFTLTGLYQGSWTGQDLNYAGLLEAYSMEDVIRTNYYDYETFSDDNTESSGFGETEIWDHSLAFIFSNYFSENFQIRTGVQLELYSRDEVYTNIEDEQRMIESEEVESGSAREIYREFNLITTTEVEDDLDQFSMYLPVVLSKSFYETVIIEAGVMAHYRKLRVENIGTFSYEGKGFEIVNGNVDQQEPFYRPEPIAETHTFSQTKMNAFGSIIIVPSKQFSLRLMGYSDRRTLGESISVDSFRLQISAEIKF